MLTDLEQAGGDIRLHDYRGMNGRNWAGLLQNRRQRHDTLEKVNKMIRRHKAMFSLYIILRS